jgi:aspartyl-tRNA(Asn)/glutamyl-tRNA(Gln) amidotransferase subunit A
MSSPQGPFTHHDGVSMPNNRETLSALAAAVQSGRTTALTLTREALRRIGALDPQLHAFCTLDASGALEAADAVDRRIARGEAVGPLAGVPLAVKDLICTAGLRTTFGSRLYENHIPQEDDVVVERLRAAGAVVIGKTNTSEFGYGAFGHNALFATTRNPWNRALTSGGSSAGSAVAVATGMVPLALGSDGGGSVRIPASLCGIFGIKPSWGRVPVYPGCRDERHPGISSWESLEHIGPMTGCAADAAVALSAMVGPTPRDRYSIPNEIAHWQLQPIDRLRDTSLALSLDLGFAAVEPEVLQIIEAAAMRLARALGGKLSRAAPDMQSPGKAFETIVAMETDRNGLRRLAHQQGVELTGWLARLLDRRWTADEFTDAIQTRKSVVNATWRLMEQHDFLLTPTTATAAFAVDIEGPATIDGQAVDPAAWVAFSSLGNFTGLPASSVPVGFTSDGLPVGLQIMGRHLDDLGVLSLSALVEALFPQPAPPAACGRWLS